MNVTFTCQICIALTFNCQTSTYLAFISEIWVDSKRSISKIIYADSIYVAYNNRKRGTYETRGKVLEIHQNFPI